MQTALFEALSFVGLLEDAAVVEALAASLLRLSHECDLALAGTHEDTSGRKRNSSVVDPVQAPAVCMIQHNTQGKMNAEAFLLTSRVFASRVRQDASVAQPWSVK